MVLAHARPLERFQKFYKSLGKDKESIETLSKFWTRASRPPAIRRPGAAAAEDLGRLTVTLENTGAWVTHGDSYRYWLSFK